MVEATAISDLFALFSDIGKAKLLILGSSSDTVASLVNCSRSLNIEHVSPSDFLRQEISRRTQFGHSVEKRVRGGDAAPDEIIISVMKRWFWGRKPDAGFAITGFPATLLQAKIFDEWLDARGETLSGIIAAGIPDHTLIDYYRSFGLLTLVDLLHS